MFLPWNLQIQALGQEEFTRKILEKIISYSNPLVTRIGSQTQYCTIAYDVFHIVFMWGFLN